MVRDAKRARRACVLSQCTVGARSFYACEQIFWRAAAALMRARNASAKGECLIRRLMESSSRTRVRAIFAGAAFFGVCAWCGRGAAQSSLVAVRVAPGSCPSGELVQRALTPLLKNSQVISRPSGAAQVAVTDDGDGYTVVIGQVQRTVPDRARDCLERARVAAVFVAMNLSELEPKPPAPKASAPEVPSAPAAPTPNGPQFSARLELSGAIARGTSLAPGGALGVALRYPTLELGFTTGALGPARLSTLGSSARESVVLWQFPATLRAALVGHYGGLSLAPSLGLSWELLRAVGEGAAHSDAGYRSQVGGVVGLEARAYIGARWQALLGADMRVFPRSYELFVAGGESLAKTPAAWLVLTLGVAYDFGSNPRK